MGRESNDQKIDGRIIASNHQLLGGGKNDCGGKGRTGKILNLPRGDRGGC